MRLMCNDLLLQDENKKSSLFSEDVEVIVKSPDHEKCKIRNIGGVYKIKRKDGKMKVINNRSELCRFLDSHGYTIDKEIYLWQRS